MLFNKYLIFKLKYLSFSYACSPTKIYESCENFKVSRIFLQHNASHFAERRKGSPARTEFYALPKQELRVILFKIVLPSSPELERNLNVIFLRALQAKPFRERLMTTDHSSSLTSFFSLNSEDI